jgi:hypothetical protein
MMREKTMMLHKRRMMSVTQSARRWRTGTHGREANAVAEAEGNKTSNFANPGGGGKSSGKDSRKALKKDVKVGDKVSW